VMPEQNWRREPIRRDMTIAQRCDAIYDELSYDCWDVPSGVTPVYRSAMEDLVADVCTDLQSLGAIGGVAASRICERWLKK
jgi:hypothetical protein